MWTGFRTAAPSAYSFSLPSYSFSQLILAGLSLHGCGAALGEGEEGGKEEAFQREGGGAQDGNTWRHSAGRPSTRQRHIDQGRWVEYLTRFLYLVLCLR